MPPAAKPKKSRMIDPFIGSRLVEGLIQTRFEDFLSDKDAALIMFYDPADPQCEWSKKHFLKAAKITNRDNASYGAVDCTKEVELCSDQNVSSLPYFKLYSRGKVLANYANPQTFTYQTMSKFMENAPVLQEPTRPKNPCAI